MENKKKKINTKKAKTAGNNKLKSKKIKNENKDIKAKSKDTKLKFKHKHPKLALALKIMLILFLILCVIGAGVVIGLIYGLWGDDLKINISDLILQENSVIVDTDGNIIAELTGDENRKIITLEEMSPYLPKAYVAIEDERFEKHHGVDIKRTGAAILSFVTHGGQSTAGGGSTITQQLVKNITQDKDSSGVKGVIRKIKEWVKAYQIEKELSKDQILELYLNLIFVGGNADNRGVEIASEYYFNKPAKELSIAQCAFLAGINHSPNSYNPYSDKDVTEKIAKRTKTVLGKMQELGYITDEEYNTAVAEVDTGFAFEKGVSGNVYSSHTDALINQLIDQIMEEKNISEDAATTYLYSSGLKIYSTQVTSVQTVMEEEAKQNKYKLTSKKTGKTAQGAAVVIEPSTGYVVGAVGQLGEKTTSRGLNRIFSERQTGSSIKPIADVIPALEEGIITPATIYADLRTTFGKDYTPENDVSYTTLRTVRNALATSQNVPFVKVMAELTPKKSMEYMKKMGISSLDEERDNNLALAIGGLTYGISPLEMAAAYATIANDGNYIEPSFYSKVEDSDGKIVLEPNQKTEKAFSAQAAYVMKDLLKSTISGADGYAGTATYCAIKGMDVAAKTGTTNEKKDRWLCGFTNYYACAAWYGYDDPETVNYSGRNPAGQLFSNIMTAIHKGKESSTFKEPKGIVRATVCRTSGKLASDKCTNKYTEVFIEGKLPETCDAHQSQYTICTASGLLANEFCPDSTRQTKSANYVVEKERLGLWNTPGINTTVETAPTEYCTVHTKPEEVIPEEPEEPDDAEPEEPTEPSGKPDDEKPTEPGDGGSTGGDSGNEKPTEPGDGGSTGGDTGDGSSTGSGNEGSSSGGSGNNTGNNRRNKER